MIYIGNIITLRFDNLSAFYMLSICFQEKLNITNIWQCVDIATYIACTAGNAEINLHDRFLKKFETNFSFKEIPYKLLYFASFKYFNNKTSHFFFYSEETKNLWFVKRILIFNIMFSARL